MNKKELNYYNFIPFIIIVFILAKFIFTNGALAWFFGAFKTLFTAFIIIYLLEPIVNFIQIKLKINRTLSVLLSYLLFFAIITLALLLIVPSIIDSIKSLAKSIPRDYKIFMDKINSFSLYEINISENEIRSLLTNTVATIAKSISGIMNYGSELLGSLANFANNVLTFFIALFMSFYALKDTNNFGKKVKHFIKGIFNKKIANFIIKVGNLTNNAVKSFLIGKITTCIILGFMTYISIVIVNMILKIRIPYAPLFGLIIGITNIIPYIGPFLGTIPCIIISLFSGLPEAIAILAIILAMQQVDNIIISPKILGESVGVKPFWIVASITIGGSLFGAWGMILSVPLTAVIQTLIIEYIEKKHKNSA